MKISRITGICVCLFFFSFLVIQPLTAESEIIKLEANASYYGDEFNGQPTSSGEVFDMNAFTAAHKTLPFGTMLEVTNLANGKKVVVRVNDRGPFVEDRELDVSKAAAEALGMLDTGVARVSIRKLDDATAAAIKNGGPVATDTNVAKDTVVDASVAKSDSSSATVPEKVVETKPVQQKTSERIPAVAGPKWRIQLGAFAREENATRLVVRLRKDGFDPAFEKTDTVTRVVLAGVSESELEGYKTKLQNAGYSDYLLRQESR